MTLLLLALLADPEPSGAIELKHPDAVTAVAWTGDGKTLVTGSAKGTVTLWDAGTGRERAKLAGHRGAVRALAGSTDGKTLVSADEEGAVLVWDLPARKLRHSLVHGFSVSGLALSPDGKRLVAAGGDERLSRYDPVTGAVGKPLRLGDLKESLGGATFAPDGKTLLVAGRVTLNEGSSWSTHHRIDLATEKVTSGKGVVQPARLQPVFAGHVSRVAWSPAGDAWAWATEDRVAVVRGRVGEPAHGRGIVGLAFLPDGKAVVSADADGNVLLSDAKTAKELARVKGLGELTGLAVSPDGKRFAVARKDGKVSVRPVPEGGKP